MNNYPNPLENLILEGRTLARRKKYYQAALTYEKIGKITIKHDAKKAASYFKLAEKYYLKSAEENIKNKQYEQTAQCYENLGKLSEKWMRNHNSAVDYFIAATKYRMMNIKDKIDYETKK